MYNNIFLVTVFRYFNKNRIFQLENYENYVDRLYFDRIYPFYLLREKFRKRNISLNTYDYFNKKNKRPYALIFLDVPVNLKRFLKKHKNIDKFLIVYESPIISKRNRDLKNHQYFKKIFTWEDKLIDNKKYFKLNYANKMPQCLDFDFGLDKKQKLCAMIVGHKFETHPQELYTERIKAIRWFEKEHPEDFDLYGINWNRHYFKDNLVRLNRLKFLTKLLKPNYPSYRGPVKSKKETYKKYKFAICYENTKGFPGYISEKIFDCFFSGCIPIYLGAPNITDYIPVNTFIDKRKFKTYEQLYCYIKNMPKSKYLNYLNAIKNFIKSDKIYSFTAESFVDTIYKEIMKN